MALKLGDLVMVTNVRDLDEAWLNDHVGIHKVVHIYEPGELSEEGPECQYTCRILGPNCSSRGCENPMGYDFFEDELTLVK